MQRFRDTSRSAAKKAADAAKKAADAASSAAEKAADATTSAAGSAAGATKSAAGKAADATTSAAGSVAGATTSAAGQAAGATASAAGRVRDGFGDTLDIVASLPADTVEQMQTAYKESLNKVFPECPVPAFELPTGPGVEDYVFEFDLDEMLENLRSGVFVRPKIEVWAAGDRGSALDHYVQELEIGFVRQFSEARDRLFEEYRPAIHNLASKERDLSNEIRREVTGPTLRSAANWTALTLLLTPPGALFLIGLGLKPRTNLFGLLRDYMGVRGERSQVQSELSSELEKLESRMDSKNRTLRRAIKRIEVKVHPRIQEIAALICEAEGVAFSPAVPEQDSDPVPDVEPYLRRPTYLERLPQKYMRFLG